MYKYDHNNMMLNDMDDSEGIAVITRMTKKTMP